jgi:hypothetical protein
MLDYTKPMSEMDHGSSFTHVGRLVTASHKTDTSKKVRKVIMKVTVKVLER